MRCWFTDHRSEEREPWQSETPAMMVRPLSKPPPSATARKSCGFQTSTPTLRRIEKSLAVPGDMRMLGREREENGASYFLLLTSYFLLLTSYFLLLTSYFLLLTSYFLLLTSYFLLLTSYFLLLTSYFLLLTSYFLLLTSYFLLLTPLHRGCFDLDKCNELCPDL